jgi:voltage-gated potassium channel
LGCLPDNSAASPAAQPLDTVTRGRISPKALIFPADMTEMSARIPNEIEQAEGGRELRTPAQQWLNKLLFDLHSPLGRNANLLGVVVILSSVLLSMVATIPNISAQTRNVIEQIEIWVTLLFAIEYVLRLYASRWPRRYIFSFYGLVDLLTWAPIVLAGEGFLAIRLLRVLRLLKLVRYLRALRVFFSSMLDIFDIVFVVLATIIIIVLIAGNVMYLLEPQTFPNAYVGCWWSLVTMTTVGYGDIVPVTIAGKIAAAVLMLTGITSFALLTGTVSIKLSELLNDREICSDCSQPVSPRAKFCQHCGIARPVPD